MPGMASLVKTLLTSLPQMLNVLILFGVFVVVSTIVGVQLFQGNFRLRCALANSTMPYNVSSNVTIYDPISDINITTEIQNLTEPAYVFQEDLDGLQVFCLEPTKTCSEGYTCIYQGNPGFGYSNWDNVLSGLMMTVELVSISGWTEDMYMVRRFMGNSYFDSYFIMVVVLGNFFVLNLLIAVQYDFLNRAFSHIANKQLQTEKKENESNGCMKIVRFCKLDTFFSKLLELRPPRCVFKIQQSLRIMVQHNAFQVLCMLVIVLNTLLLASQHYNQPKWLENMQNTGNNVFSIIFIVETVLRFVALGPTEFMQDGFNIFDSVVNVFSIFDLLNIGPSFVVLRGFRLLRIFKIIRSIKGLIALLETVLKSIGAIANLSFLIFIFVYVFALVGKSFFYDPMYSEDGTESRYSYRTIDQAMVLIFIILTADDWSHIMRMIAHTFGAPGLIHCTLAMVVGHFMLLNLFLAILLKYIDQDIEHKQPEVSTQKKIAEQIRAISELDQSSSSQCLSDSEESVENSDRITERKNQEQESCSQSDDTNRNVLKQQNSDQKLENSREPQNNIELTEQQQVRQEIKVEGNSLMLISPDSKPRVWLWHVLRHPYFETFIFYMIAVNSVILIIDDPELNNQYTQSTIRMISDVLSGIFIAECIAKIFVMGFICGKTTYLREGFNILDFFIVVISIADFLLDYFQTNLNISYLKAFRALRALRPLKLVSKNMGMRLVVNSLLNSLSGIGNVMLISVLFYTVFGILGVQFLAGCISTCQNLDYREKAVCEQAGYQWLTPSQNYDDFFHSTLTFFEVSTLEGWSETMHIAMDSAYDVDTARVMNNQPAIQLVYIVFIFITSFFVMNLFISVIVNKFQEEKEKTEGTAELSDDQKEWVKIQRYLAEVYPPNIAVEPENNFRKFLFNLVESTFFEGLVQSVIVLNTITLLIAYYGAPDQFDQAISVMNLIFLVFFFLELVLKLIGYGYSHYFSQTSNFFDFTITILSFLSIDDNTSTLFNTTVFRIIRVARLLRMIKASKSLQSLLKTLYLAVYNILNVTMLLLLVLFAFAVAAMNLFGGITQGPEGYINSQANFNSFYNSMITLFRCMTGEAWNGLMHDCAQVGAVGYIFWILYTFVANFIYINVFIAVIYEEFKSVQTDDETTEVLSIKRRDISNFVNTWSKFNPQGQHYMKTEQLKPFLQELPPPLGYKGLKIQSSKLFKIIYCLNIRDHQGKVYFPEVMWAIFYSVIGNNDRALSRCQQIKQIMQKLKNKYKGLNRNITLNSICGNKYWQNEMTVTKYLSGMIILKNMRELIKRKSLLKSSESITSPELVRQRTVKTQDSLCKRLKNALQRNQTDKEKEATESQKKAKRSSSQRKKSKSRRKKLDLGKSQLVISPEQVHVSVYNDEQLANDVRKTKDKSIKKLMTDNNAEIKNQPHSILRGSVKSQSRSIS